MPDSPLETVETPSSVDADELSTEEQVHNENIDALGSMWNESDIEEKENVTIEQEKNTETEKAGETDIQSTENKQPEIPDDQGFPDYISKDFEVPESFASDKDKMEWYEENYQKAVNIGENKEYIEHIRDKHKEELIANHTDMEKMEAISQALSGKNGHLTMKIFFPELAKDYGIENSITKEEADLLVVDNMKKEFGDDFQEQFDTSLLANPRSNSSKMWNRQQEMYKDIDNHNHKMKEEAQQRQPMSQEEMNTFLDKEYDTDFKDILSKEEYNNFVKEADQYKTTILGIYRAMNFEKLIEEATNKGIELGKKNLTKDLNKAGAEKVEDGPKEDEKKDEDDWNPLTGIMPNNDGYGIPKY